MDFFGDGVGPGAHRLAHGAHCGRKVAGPGLVSVWMGQAEATHGSCRTAAHLLGLSGTDDESGRFCADFPQNLQPLHCCGSSPPAPPLNQFPAQHPSASGSPNDSKGARGKSEMGRELRLQLAPLQFGPIAIGHHGACKRVTPKGSNSLQLSRL